MANYTVIPYTADLAHPYNPDNSIEMTITPDEGYVISASDFSVGADAPANKATLTTGELVLTAKTAGAAGNDITFAITDVGDGGTITVTVATNAISVAIDIETDTAAEIKAAIIADAGAGALVDPTVTNGGGTAIDAVVAVTALTEGWDLTVATFADSDLGAGVDGNTVTCTIDTTSLIALTGDTTFSVDIEGDAVLWNPVDGGGPNEVDTVVNVINCGSNGAVSVGAANNSVVAGISGTHHGKPGDVVTKTGITTNSVTKIATITVTASGGNEFLKAPVLKHGYTSGSVANTEDMLSLDFETATDGSTTITTTGKTTVYTFGLNYRASKDFTAVDDITVCVDYETVLAVPLADTITKIDYGSSYVNHLGETRTISIYGKQGATFNYGLTNSATTIIPTTGTQTIPYAGDFNTGQGVFTFDAAIPAADSSTVTLTVTPVSPTVNPATSDQTAIANAIDQKKETNLLFTVVGTDETHIDSITDITSSEFLDTTKPANTDVEDLMHKRGTVNNFQLKFNVTGTDFDAPVNPVWPGGDSAGGFANKWSNADLSTNGGTVVNITNIIGVGTATAYAFTANVSIERYGSTDVTMELNLANILKTS
jgi:hypothetical protein